MKKEATLDGVRRGLSVDSHGVSSVAPLEAALDGERRAQSPLLSISHQLLLLQYIHRRKKINRGMETDPERIEAEAITKIIFDGAL